MPRKKTEEKKEEAEVKSKEDEAKAESSKTLTKPKKKKEKKAKEEAPAKVPVKTVSLKKKPEEIEELIVNLAQRGNSSSQIGMILRDTYGIADVKKATGQNISKILEKHKLKTLTDLEKLIKRANELSKHIERNKQDQVAKKGLLITESKISKLSKYYKKKGMLPEDWKYK